MLDAAKSGSPQAIAAMINKSLEAKDMFAKVSSNNGCLTIVVESGTAPAQAPLVSFLKKGINSLKPANISQVIVRGRATGDTTNAWQDSFRVNLPEVQTIERTETPVRIESQSSISTSLTNLPDNSAITQRSSGRLIIAEVKPESPLVSFIKNRNGERAVIAAGTFLLTSALWVGVGTLRSGRQVPVASNSPNVASSSTLSSTESPQPVPTVFSVQGSFVLVDSDIGGTATDCYGSGGYSDVESGMPVTIRDGKGDILATGNTGTGSQPEGKYSQVQCVFEFKIDNVPKADFYAIEIGRRGQLNYSFDEMQKRNWTVSLSLGS